jgi:hypothetical protein
MTIAMDGTDQLNNGLPQFREISKDDCGQMRIKNHLEIVQIAASPDIVKCFVVPEDIPNDTNVSVEVLQRTLKAEEERRGGLPPILHLQLDNCRGANKNSYLFTYVAWLVEREVFTVVFVSFLPVGHTHNGPDRIASRISNAVRRTDIHTEERFHEIIRTSHNPNPEVIPIEEVVAFKEFVNPDLNPAFTNARCRQLTGLCTLRPPTLPSLANYAGETSNLHFRIAMDPTTGRVCIQNRQTIDVPDWSPLEYVWNPRAEWPLRDDASPIDFTDWLQTMNQAASRPTDDKRHKELVRFLEGCAKRLDPQHHYDFVQTINAMHVQRLARPLSHWADDGQFRSEFERQIEEEERPEEHPIQINDRNCIIFNRADQDAARHGSLKNTVNINDFIAYRPFYTEDVAQDKRKPFYIGRVTHTVPAEQKVQIKTYWTNRADPLIRTQGRTVQYKPWRARNTIQDVAAKDIMHVFNIEETKWKLFTFTSKLKEVMEKILSTDVVNNAVDQINNPD